MGIGITRRGFIAASGAAVAHSALRASGAPAAPRSGESFPANPFDAQGQWYKASLHAHTTTSDGDVGLSERLAQYRQRGFQVVAVTDHWKTNDLKGQSDDSFLAISGMEVHPRTGTGAPAHHFVCLGLPHPFTISRELAAQAVIDEVTRVGGKVIYAHPYWNTHTIAEMMEVTGYAGVEVYNAVCETESGKGFGSVHWDQVLNKGRIVPAVASDDVHKSPGAGLCWTMIRAPALNTTAILEAIGAGCFYASTGPVVEDWRIEGGVARLKCSPVSTIRFLCSGAGGGRVQRAAAGKTIESAEWKIEGNRRWIRAEVEDAQGRRAWTNPLPASLPAAKPAR